MFGPFKKEKPLPSFAGFGGGIGGFPNKSGASGPDIEATGGTKSTTPTYTTHTFQSPGNFVVTSGSGDIQLLMVSNGQLHQIVKRLFS